MAKVNNIGSPPVLPNGPGPTTISVSPVENPITWIFESETVGTSTAKAQAFFYFSGTVTSGQTITVNGKVFEAVAFPDLGQILASAVAVDVAASFKQALEDDPTIAYRYKIGITSGHTVTMEAMKPGSKYTITASTTSGGVAVFGVTSGTDKKRSQTLNNYSVWVEVWANLSGPIFGLQSTAGAQLLRRLDLPANEADRYIFDVSATLRPLVRGSLPFTNVVNFERQETSVVSYFLRYGEAYTPSGGTGLARFEIGKTDPAFALNMAIPILDAPILSKYGNPFTPGGLVWLNENPAKKISRRDAMEFIYLLYVPQTTAPRYLSLWVKITYVDGSTLAKFFTKTALARPGVIYWRADYQALNLAAYTGSGANAKEVLFWAVEVVEHSGAIPVAPAVGNSSRLLTRAQTFKLSDNCEPRPLLLFWLSPLGAWESFSFDGFQDVTAEFSKTTFERAIPSEFSVNRRSEKVRAVTSSEAFIVYVFRSDLIDTAHHAFLLGLFSSPSVYWFDGVDFRYVAEISGKWERKGEDYLHQVAGRFKLTVPQNTLKE